MKAAQNSRCLLFVLSEIKNLMDFGTLHGSEKKHACACFFGLY